MDLMEELLASLSSTPISLERGQEIEGKIISINSNEITVDLGLKSEGVISGREFQNDVKNKLKTGDTIKAIVSEVENENGQVVLSMQRSGQKKAQAQTQDLEKWNDLIKKLDGQDIIKGKVTKITQFGIFVELQGGIEGLIHISKLKSDDKFEVGQQLSVSVDSIDQEKKRISLSEVKTSTKGLIYK
ncbi:hypothetical protein A3F00_02230 [Candidatus Daviesbacteria bacterium RIFCSPHIGHO2_12_FULL_37_11]|uniref:S1 motif domain-containing protein n=1 Tax=Candidatus Daviesbacteria bacterium RIFCSPHIGHO2_12_FULL_37_11 TaxID=1797777 RepID=A0A1F5KDG4_9BACT|nr:MAG: hypothetical protein A3F00_02230 [Candidatus Daviesbacteria bacterium RIFCSPHIGHO2_12_FULL_37_11]